MISVNDPRSNVNDNLKSAADFLSRSEWRRDIWTEIHRGKAKPKTAKAIGKRLRRDPKRVLMTGNELAKAHLVEKVKFEGQVAYVKDSFLDQHKRTIMRWARDKKARDRVPTKVNPRGSAGPSTVSVTVWKPFDVRQISIDDIESFKKVRRIQLVPAARLALPERTFKEGIKKIIRESGRFVDRPDERNDLLSDRVVVRGKRTPTAFAFKGPGKNKKLLQPSDMGKHGDQIQKLFNSPADLFVLQYWGQVSETVREMVRSFAELRSGHYAKRVTYCIIDGTDSDRIVLAYPAAFEVR